MALLAGQGYLLSILIREGELRCFRAGLEHGTRLPQGEKNDSRKGESPSGLARVQVPGAKLHKSHKGQWTDPGRGNGPVGRRFLLAAG
jgi:hypothetical protein